MSAEWFLKSGTKIVGPITDKQLKRMAEDGKIDPQTQIAKSPKGPYTNAGSIKVLFAEFDEIEEEDEEEVEKKPLPRDTPADEPSLLKVAVDALKSRKVGRRTALESSNLSDSPMLALWLLSIAAGLLSGVLAYGILWKSSGPIWLYGSTLVPPS